MPSVVISRTLISVVMRLSLIACTTVGSVSCSTSPASIAWMITTISGIVRYSSSDPPAMMTSVLPTTERLT